MTRGRPPFLARLLLTWLLPVDTREFALGDLEEMHGRRVLRRGRLRADAWYWRAALRSLAGQRRTRRGGSTVAGLLGGLLLDGRAAVRSLRRTPGFTGVAGGTLALGLGTTIAVYAVADGLLLRVPAGVHDEGRAVYVEFGPADAPGDVAYLSPADVRDLREAAEGLVDALSAVTATPLHVSAEGTTPVRATVGFVDGPWFDLLGVRAAAGRLPAAHELSLNASPAVAVIGERLWATHFARAGDVVGATLRVNGRPFTVVGVAAEGFVGLERGAPVAVWLPVSALPQAIDYDVERLSARNATLYPNLVGRLSAGVSVEAAAAGLRRAAERIAESLPAEQNTLEGHVPRVYAGVHVPPAARVRTRQSLGILTLVVALVLVVTCANVANLFLFRSLREAQDVRVRRALGASRLRIVAQQLTSHALITVGALAAGLGLAWAITRPFVGRSLPALAGFTGLALDGRLVLFASAAAIGTLLLAGVLPSWVAARGGTAPSAGGGMRATGRHGRLRGAMTVLQLTASLALGVAALLLVRTVRTLYAIDPGYAIGSVHVVPLDLPARGDAETRTLEALARAEAVVARVPGVERTALDIGGPLVSRLRGPVVRSGGDATGRTFGIVTFVAPGWFELMDVRVVRGRAFGSEDRGPAGRDRVILSDGLARTLFGDADPIGRTIRAFGRSHDVQVVGVVEDIRYAHLLSDPEPVVYHPWSEPFLLGQAVLLYRTGRGAGDGTAALVREALSRAEPQFAVDGPVPLAARVDEQLAEHRLFAHLLALLSSLAAVLAGVGLYGVVAYGVTDRAREFGIRMALGARGPGIARLVLRQTARTVAIGAVFGTAAALLLARALASRLPGVGAADWRVHVAAVLGLALMAALACAGPVRSATNVDPARMLRGE